MSECSVVSKLLNANEGGERYVFSSNDSIVGGNFKPNGNESESSTEVINTIKNCTPLCCVLNICWCE